MFVCVCVCVCCDLSSFEYKRWLKRTQSICSFRSTKNLSQFLLGFKIKIYFKFISYLIGNKLS